FPTVITHPVLPPFPTRRSSDLSVNRCRPSLAICAAATVVTLAIAACSHDLPNAPNAAPPPSSAQASHIHIMPLIGHALPGSAPRSEEHTSELQSRENLVCRLLL